MRWAVILALCAAPAAAETLVPLRTIRAQQIVGPADLGLIDETVPGALTLPDEAIGQEARRTLYAGRPIRAEDLGPPAIVERNAIVSLAYSRAGLRILTEGRALARGGAGDVIRVMNLASKSTVTGRIAADGSVIVGPSP